MGFMTDEEYEVKINYKHKSAEWNVYKDKFEVH